MTSSQFDLTNKVALVTGASKGIGRAIADALAEAGASVALVSRTQSEVEQAADEIRQRGVRTLGLAADVSAADQVGRVMQAVAKEFGRIDILVNNAGFVRFAKAEELRESTWDKIMNVNLKGVFLCSQAAGRVMIEQRSGAIINIASMAGIIGEPALLAYSASKAGVINMTKVLAVEWAKHNIRVNAIAPGFVDTPMTEWYKERPELAAKVDKDLPLHRPARPEEVGAVAVFLASDAASYVTGQTINVEGASYGITPTIISMVLGYFSLDRT